MNKKEQWPGKLSAFIQARQYAPFVWGQNDCCLFAADAIEAMTGKDPAAAFRGRYTTAIGSRRALIRYGSRDIKSTLADIFGQSIPRLKAIRGDIVYIETEQGSTAGIVFGAGIVAPGQDGLKTIPINQGLAFWSIDQWQ